MERVLTRADIPQSRRWIIKIGSSLLTHEGKGLVRPLLDAWVDQIVAHWRQGRQVIVVSSGAVAEGMARMGWRKRPAELAQLQAAAAIGQMGLVQAWEESFNRHQMQAAQVLLTHPDLSSRVRYLNARSTLRTLLDLGVVPIINENDTVVTEELRFGDNDGLAAQVANLIDADLLVLLTDRDGLYTADPKVNLDAKLIHSCQVDDPLLDQVAGDSGSLVGSGGMRTKIRAARIAARSGTPTLITNGQRPNIIAEIAQGIEIGTFCQPAMEVQAARKRWLAGQLKCQGKLVLDAGATEAVLHHGKSVLAAGVVDVQGMFQRGEVVSCVDQAGQELARGLVNYDAQETAQIKGHSSQEFLSILGYQSDAELIHRDNLVLLTH